MANFLIEIRALRDEGKLHRRLLIRMRMLLAIGISLLGVVAYNVYARGAGLAVIAPLFAAGFSLGLLVFSRMNRIQWNEEEERMEGARMDRLGYALLALYIVCEIGLRTLLKDYYPENATIFLLSGISGTLLGRVVGTMVEIHRAYTGARGS